MSRLTSDWVTWLRERVQRLNEKLDDDTATTADQLFFQAHVVIPGKIRRYQSLRNLEVFASHLSYILNPVRPARRVHGH